MAEKPESIDPDLSEVQLWIRQYIAVYGHNAVTRYSKRRLNGVSLVRAIQALELGTVTKVGKVSDTLYDCDVEYVEDDGSELSVKVTVKASVNYSPPELVIRLAEEGKKESESGTDHAA